MERNYYITVIFTDGSDTCFGWFTEDSAKDEAESFIKRADVENVTIEKEERL